MNKNVVYTAVYGGKDVLKDPLYINEGFDYICFTDDESIKSDIWEIIHKPPISEDPVRSAKIFKVKPHEYLKNYETSIWIDANFLICSDLQTFISCMGPHANILAFSHDQGRNCIYEEAKVVSRDNKDDPNIIESQMSKYRKEEYPVNNGLTANSILLRRHNEQEVENMMNLWWSEIINFSRRDQLSFCYCKWKTGTKMYMLKFPNYNIRMNNWFRWLPHNYEAQPWST